MTLLEEMTAIDIRLRQDIQRVVMEDGEDMIGRVRAVMENAKIEYRAAFDAYLIKRDLQAPVSSL